MDEDAGEESFSMETALKNMIKRGNLYFQKRRCKCFLRSLFFDRLEQERANFMRILLLVLAAALFSNFAAVFENGQIGDVSFYMIYLLLFTILMNSYQSLGISLGKQLDWLTQFMKGLAPAYFVAVSGGKRGIDCHCFLSGSAASCLACGMAAAHPDPAGSQFVRASLPGKSSVKGGHAQQNGRASGNLDQLEPENHAGGCAWASGCAGACGACHGCHQADCHRQNSGSHSGSGKCR